ncbi:MAG: carboxypeptidase-like regulatory domain-containing protein [Acidobacteriota bacterium]
MHIKFKLLLLSVALLTLVARTTVPVMAQNPTGSISGLVKDQQGAVITNGNVTVTNKATGAARTTNTGGDGIYAVENLPAGDYEVKIEAEGFATNNISVVVQVGSLSTVNATLRAGTKAEVVDVVAEAPIIDKLNYKIDGVVNRMQVENLPLNGRNFLQLALLEPGVGVTSVDNPGSSPNNFFRVSIAGASQALTRISVDGATINDRVTGGTSQNFSQESVQEFQISTFQFDLSTSTTSVGSVNVVSRSGSNAFHGSAFMYYRDHNLGAYPLLKRDARTKDPFFARRQMGGSLGGPIKKDRAFFFFNGEYNNQDSVLLVSNNHPIWSKFDGAFPQPLTFKQTNLKIDFKVNDKHNAFVRFSTDNNHNFNGDGGTMPSYWVPTRNVSTQALGGVTSVFTGNVVNDFRYSYSFYSGRLRIPDSQDCPDPVACIGLGGPQTFTTLAPQFIIGNNVNVPQNRVLRTYQMTDTLNWQKGSHRLRFGGEWEHFYGVGKWAFLEPSLNVPYDPLHLLAIVAGVVASPTTPAAVKAAVAGLYNNLPASIRLNATGTGPLNDTVPTLFEIQQLPLYQFFTGIGEAGQPQPFNLKTASHNNRIRGFFADQWRVSSRFTLNYGIAYSVETNILNHDLDRPPILSALLGGNLKAPHRDKNNWDPSVGFAWDVKGDGKTVIRGGAGVYHDANLFWTRLNERAYTGPAGNGRLILPSSFYGLDFSVFNNPANPFDQKTLLGRILTNTVLTVNGLNAILPGLRAATLAGLGNGKDLSVRGVELIKTTGNKDFGGIFDPDTVSPLAYNVSVGVQRELASNLVVSADFVMRRSLHFGGLHNTLIVDENRFDRFINGVRTPVIPLCVGAQAADPKAICSSGPIAVSHSAANFRYTGLHVKVDKRFSSHYLFVASYALSKFTGYNNVPGASSNGPFSIDDFKVGEDYQASDRRHRLTFSGFVDLPAYKGDNKFTRGALNGWQFGLIMPIVSSPPLSNVISNTDLDGDGINSLILPGGTLYGFGTRYGADELRLLVNQYNATIAGKPTGRPGQIAPLITLPAKIDNGDTFISQDVRLTRNIGIGERVKLQLIGEGFNILNISNLAGYSGVLNGANFGTATTRAGGTFGTGGPRSFQFAARLQF